MATSKITLLPSITKVDKEQSTTLFINKTPLMIITINMNLTFLSYSN